MMLAQIYNNQKIISKLLKMLGSLDQILTLNWFNNMIMICHLYNKLSKVLIEQALNEK